METSDVLHVLSLEALAIEVFTAFGSRGIAALVFKGPVTNSWLYGDPLARRFCDVDVLVSPSSELAAKSVLSEMGFSNDHARVLGIHRPDYESSWTIAAGTVDLHTRLAGIPANRAHDAWNRLAQESVEFHLHGQPVETLSVVARTMLLGLHAARRSTDTRALRDLEVGLSTLSEPLWREAAALTTELDAGACFAVGLRRSAAGQAMLRVMDYSAAPTVEAELLKRDAPQEAIVLAAALEVSGRVVFRQLISWFSTEEEQRPSIRSILAAMARFPRAVMLSLHLRRQVRRHVQN